MAKQSKEAIFNDLVDILNNLRDDWEYSVAITQQTSLLNDLDFESIDAVAMGSAIEEHYNQSLPFAEFLTELGEQENPDLRVGDLVDFIYKNLE